MSELVSVVIPVYNVEPYLSRCIESVISQTYKKLEIILVDDGSSDSSGNICDKYSEQDSRIRVIHKKNGGLSDARNAGIRIATGRFISFIDSDDYVSLDYIEYLYQMIKKYQTDIAICSYEKVTDKKTSSHRTYIDKRNEEIISGKTALERFCYQKIPQEAWGKLYKIELFNTVSFPIGKIYEDYGTIYKLFYLSSQVAIGFKKLYFYYIRPQSIMNSTFSMHNMDRAILTEEFLDFIKNNEPDLEAASYTRGLISYLILLRDCPRNTTYYNEWIYIKKKVKNYSRLAKNNRFNSLKIRIISNIAAYNIGILRLIGKIEHWLK